ncbi:MAG: SDR family NAD(P)-dependent oxidoreductase, partial [Granulosicoccaceae bacterium]
MTTNTVLITGASSGIGRQLATDYHAKGWKVIACGRDQSRLQQTPAHVYLHFDVQDLMQTLEAAEELIEPLDLVILNAGTCEYIDDAKQFDALLMQRVLTTNVVGVANCLQAFNKSIREGGQLALMGSAATHLPFSRAQAYGASKAAIA